MLLRLDRGQTYGTASAGGLEPLVKIGVYYLHERAWQQVPRGTVRRFLRSG